MARYEKTIATSDYLFAITIPTSYASVYSLLSPGDKAIIDATNTTDILDGYVVSYAGSFTTNRTNTGTGEETVQQNEKYGFPFENWLAKVNLKSGSNIVAVVRVFVN